MSKSLSILTIGAILICTEAFAQREPCTQAQNIQAEEESGSLRSWDALYNSYRTYAHCENVSAGEGYSESVARILVDHWNTLPRLSDLAGKDPLFRQFVVLHVDATLRLRDLKKITSDAQTRCPSRLTRLCADLARKADSAIKEDAALGIE
jgi:hypothetical protein